MRDVNYRNWIFAILIVSALFRFGFLAFGDVLPVMWDARRYACAALGLISYVDQSGVKQFNNEIEDRYAFKYYYDEYIEGEQINWLSYNPHTLTQARDENFFSGPLYPFFLSIIFYLSPIADFTFARILGILMDLLSNLLLIVIAFRLAGRIPALIAAVIYALYFPFIQTATMLLLETSTTFWLLLSMYLLIRGVEDNRHKYFIFAGIVTGLLILNKPTAMLLGVPLGLGLIIYSWHKLSSAVIINRLLLYAVPVLVIFISWFAVASIKYDQLTLRDPTYKEANLRQSSNIPFEGYDLDKIEKDFWEYSISEHILGDPSGYAGLLLKKMERMWSRPYNDFKKTFIIPYRVNEIYHKLFMGLGLIGLLVAILRNFSHTTWLFLIAGYYTGIHVIFHSISRYSFNAVPMLMITAAYLIYELYRQSQDNPPFVKKRIVLSLAIILLVWIFDYRWFSVLTGIVVSQLMVYLVNIIKVFALVFALFGLSRILLKDKSSIKKLLMPVVVTFVFIVFGWSYSQSRCGWAEYPCRLDSDSMKAGTRIYISDLRKVNPGELLTAVVDMNSGQGRLNTFSVNVGSNHQEFVGGKPPLSNLFYPKPTYRYYAEFEPLGLEQFRQYAIIPVNDTTVREQLAQLGYIDLEIAINEQFEESHNYINIYGNYPVSDTLSYIPGIRFTSIERYVHKNDPRIRYPVKYLSDSTISYYIKRSSKDINQSTDLSPSPGIQTGRYNMFLVHFLPDGEFLVY